nr:MAG TPA: hypothetical protein [Caudoviricetes sp.]
MQNLTVIENELVPVYETDKGIKVVNGRELHEVLQSKQDFSTWVKKRLMECDAEEKSDFDRLHKKMEANNATMIEYIIKLDTAKEMAMLERNEKGKQVRRYFIQVEKKFKTGAYGRTQLPQTTDGKIALLAQGHIEIKEEIESVRQELEDFKQDMPLLAVECDRITTAVHKRGVDALGGKNSNAYKDSSLRSKVYQDIHRELKRQFGVSTYKAIKRSQCDIAVSIIEEYELPIVLQEQIRDCNSQISMEVA